MGLAGVRKHQQRIGARDRAEIAMARFGGMDEMRRRARRGQSRGDLARDVAGLAHPAHDHPAFDTQDGIDCPDEIAVQRLAQRAQRADRIIEHPVGSRQVGRRLLGGLPRADGGSRNGVGGTHQDTLVRPGPRPPRTAPLFAAAILLRLTRKSCQNELNYGRVRRAIQAKPVRSVKRPKTAL